jgi:hypothetical protein
MIIIIEKDQKILSQVEMTSCSCTVSFTPLNTHSTVTLSDILVLHLTRYLPPPATSQRVLRGDITVTMEELLSKDSLTCPYATSNNAFELFISSFSPKPSTRSGQLFLSSYPNLSLDPSNPLTSSAASVDVELRIHVMDGLNYPHKQKTNALVQFDLLTFQRDSLDSQSVNEVIISSIQTNESIHPRQLVWDHKLSIPLPANIIQSVYQTLFPSSSSELTTLTSAAPSNAGERAVPERYHLKVSLIQIVDEQVSPRDHDASISSQQVQALLIKDLSELLKPLFLTNTALLAAKPSFSLSSKRHEIVLPLPFEPHLLLNSSFSSTSSDPSVRLRIGLLLVESSTADNETKSLAKARVLERFEQKSGESPPSPPSPPSLNLSIPPPFPPLLSLTPPFPFRHLP